MTISSIAPQQGTVEPVAVNTAHIPFINCGAIFSGALVADTCFFIATAFATATEIMAPTAQTKRP
jgi:hypothetical protein